MKNLSISDTQQISGGYKLMDIQGPAFSNAWEAQQFCPTICQDASGEWNGYWYTVLVPWNDFGMFTPNITRESWCSCDLGW